MRSITFSLLVFAAGCLTQTAFASDFVGKRGGWEVYRSEDGCSMGMEFEGPGDTELTLLKFTDATFGLLITNSNWSSKEGAEYDIRYVLNGMEFSGGKARGISVSYRKGFAGFFPSSFERHLAAGDSLHIYMGEQRIDQLSLSGTTVALALVNQCLNGVRAIKAAEAREKARWEHLPKDPFAGGAGIVPNQSVVPIGSAASWATMLASALVV